VSNAAACSFESHTKWYVDDINPSILMDVHVSVVMPTYVNSPKIDFNWD
jgi:hypothetical protein